MFKNTADCQADAERFVQRVATTEVVWYLNSENGAASAESYEAADDTGEPLSVLLFFSDEAYARRAQASHFLDYQIAETSLFNFLFRWLPGMSGDGVLAGPNWDGNLTGLEMDPFELREAIEERLTEEQAKLHRTTYETQTGG